MNQFIFLNFNQFYSFFNNEFFLLFLVIILGIIFGTFSGLFPGIHVNLIAFLVLVYFDFLKDVFRDDFLLIVFLLVMGLTHTFLDFIPSIFFGIVDETTSVSLMPSQKLLIERKGLDAIYHSSWGSFFGGVISFILIFILLFFLKSIYSFFNPFIPYFLIFVVLVLILTEKEKKKIFWAVIITLFSGGIGVLLLNSNHISNPLLVLFIGIFSLPSIFDILIKKNQNKSTIDILKKQNFFLCSEIKVFKIISELKSEIKLKENIKIKKKLKIFYGVLFTSFFSLISSISPGISSSISAIFSSLFISKLKNEMKVFLISMTNTINFLISIIVFYLIEKSRNGLIVSISNFYKFSLIDLISIFIIFFFILFLIKRWMFFLGVFLLKKIKNLNLYLIYAFLFIFLIFFIYFFEGIFGILYLINLFFLGYLVYFINIKRIILMNSLIIPVILYLI